MKIDDYKNRSIDELNHLLGELKAKILKLNFDLADSKVHDYSQIKKTKKDIARILTVIKEQKNVNSN